jgi:hypothetical protein
MTTPRTQRPDRGRFIDHEAQTSLASFSSGETITAAMK